MAKIIRLTQEQWEVIEATGMVDTGDHILLVSPHLAQTLDLLYQGQLESLIEIAESVGVGCYSKQRLSFANSLNSCFVEDMDKLYTKRMEELSMLRDAPTLDEVLQQIGSADE